MDRSYPFDANFKLNPANSRITRQPDCEYPLHGIAQPFHAVDDIPGRNVPAIAMIEQALVCVHREIEFFGYLNLGIFTLCCVEWIKR